MLVWVTMHASLHKSRLFWKKYFPEHINSHPRKWHFGPWKSCFGPQGPGTPSWEPLLLIYQQSEWCSLSREKDIRGWWREYFRDLLMFMAQIWRDCWLVLQNSKVSGVQPSKGTRNCVQNPWLFECLSSTTCLCDDVFSSNSFEKTTIGIIWFPLTFGRGSD